MPITGPVPPQRPGGAKDRKVAIDVGVTRIRVANDICDAQRMGILETAGRDEFGKIRTIRDTGTQEFAGRSVGT